MTYHGPGPIIHGQDRNDPNVFIVQLADGTVERWRREQVARIPIEHQWFTRTINGLIASWANRATAEIKAAERGTLLGQIMPVTRPEVARLTANWDPVHDCLVILTDHNGTPLRGDTA